MIREHTSTTANNSCVAADYIMLEEIVSCEKEETTPETRILASSPSGRLSSNEANLFNQEGECVIVDCSVLEEVSAPEEENVSSETAALSSSSPLAGSDNRTDIIAEHRTAADLAATESEYRNYRNDITLSYLRYHSFSLLSGVVYMSLMVIALWKICNGVGVEVEREESGKSDCSKMLLGLPLALLPFLFGIQVCLCCFRRIGIRRLEEDFYAEDEQEVTPTISLSSLPPQTTPITETNRITVQTPEDGNH